MQTKRLVLEAYSLGAYSLGAYSLGAYSLEAYSLEAYSAVISRLGILFTKGLSCRNDIDIEDP